jgi:glycosyltransferase involved in cell wall biosynthesis
MKRVHKKLVVMLRVKDGILFVEDWLNNVEKLANEIVVVDNGSTDGTYEILKRHPKVVSIDRTEGFDEGRDKILAFERAKERNPDWILWLDIDEIFEERLTRKKLERMMTSTLFSKYHFRRFHFYRDYDHIEGGLKKLYEISWHNRVLWKNQSCGYFVYKHIHCDLIRGIKGLSWYSSYRIKHFGAVNKEYLHKKTEIYSQVDPSRADFYKKQRDQVLPRLKWYEYKENPLMVIALNWTLNFFFIINVFQRLVLKIVIKIK